MSRFPFVTPTTWPYFGRDWVLFRTESGGPQVLNAFCSTSAPTWGTARS
jgi:hypothetical protein